MKPPEIIDQAGKLDLVISLSSKPLVSVDWLKPTAVETVEAALILAIGQLFMSAAHDPPQAGRQSPARGNLLPMEGLHSGWRDTKTNSGPVYYLRRNHDLTA